MAYAQPDLDDDFIAFSNDLLPCQFCEILYPASELIIHQTGCRPDIVSFGNSSKPTKPSIMNNQPVPSVKPIRSIASVVNAKSDAFVPLTLPVIKPVPVQPISKPAKQTTDTKKEEKKIDLISSPHKKEKDKFGSGFHNFNLHISSSPNSGENQQEDDAPVEEDDYVYSSEEDDDYESLESFWKRAEMTLKKRMSQFIPEDSRRHMNDWNKPQNYNENTSWQKWEKSA